MKQTRTGPCCNICGKPLTDPVSVERGIGPECYGSQKRREHADKTGNLFAPPRADYTWGVDGHVLWIIDNDNGKSVTNDIEFVLGDIFEAIGQDLFSKLVMYRDSRKIWDGVRLKDRNVVKGIQPGGERSPYVVIDDFFSINEMEYQPAKMKLLATYNQNKLSCSSI